jgi:hypothetical protein
MSLLRAGVQNFLAFAGPVRPARIATQKSSVFMVLAAVPAVDFQARAN